MAILKVARLGHPVIRTPAQAVPKESIASPPAQRIIDDMIETMREYDGVGLAAPQVHLSKQIAVIEVQDNRRYPGEGPIPLTVLVNPKILNASRKQLEDWEGCLSVHEFRGRVPRAESLEVEAYNRKGEKIRFHAQGFFARVIQHECDHLAGKVFLDRMPTLSTLTHLHEFLRYWQT
ncbi:MAG: peptide deformylase [Candidatus Omnitrophica bacterium]|nr:peptide deformylase [Candidatus Omnitrophota bacterium]MBI3020922.1 peptide deformylase [Candidatus Omnitrophota bacterium]MBI3083839.1 peptide deformylase [Candidatus Omnitrophota bacterium]